MRKILNRYIFLAGGFVLTGMLHAQPAPPKHSLESYVSNMQSVITDSLKGNWISDNLIHNRLNYSWYPGAKLSFSAQVRNRVIYGESVKYNPGYAASIDNDRGFMDLSVNLVNEESFFINSTLDRLYLKYSSGKLVTTIGRQRINWGQNYVWNPNDIFNVQNFFDFDYIEKPGSDAVRLQYYTGAASDAELVAKLDHDQKMTAAAYYRLNFRGYDLQVLAGILADDDYVVGAGFAGNIKSAGFNGELSYFRPKENPADSGSLLLFGIGTDYMFSNSIYLQVEGLYKHTKEKGSISDFISWYSGDLNVKKLSFTDLSLFANISYPFTPLLNGSLSCMAFPGIKGFFTGPSLNYSITDNMEFSLVTQFFSGKLPDPATGEDKTNSLFLGFMRYKLSF